MAGTEPIFGDAIALSVGGVDITIGQSVAFKRTWKNLTAAATWGSNEVDKPVSYKDVMTVPFEDMVGNVDFDALWNMADGTVKAILMYPEGNVAGKPVWSGNAYVAVDGFDLGIEKAASGTLTLTFVTCTKTPNIVLAAQTMTAGQANAAYAGFQFAASGGTAPYTYSLPDGAFPVEGLSMTTGNVTGTPNTNAPVAVHRFKLRVTDDASTPVVKDFDCSISIIAA